MTILNSHKQVAMADVCVLLEGTYPFIHGGVASWMHQIISGLPDITFALVFVGSRRRDYGKPLYRLPKNVLHLETHYLEDVFRGCRSERSQLHREHLKEVSAVHAYFAAARNSTKASSDIGLSRVEIERHLDRVLENLERSTGIRTKQFLYSSAAWEFIRDQNRKNAPHVPFIDYFWTLRLMHGIIFQLARIAEQAPHANLYHTISTGYAGLLGVLIERRRRRPLILSEHGIYTKERRIDLNQACWLDRLTDENEPGLRDPSANIRNLWIRYFEDLGRLTYRTANPIISLYAGNRARQLNDGAPKDRTRIIVNGINAARFEAALTARSEETPHVVGFIGRVVPIKNVKTFIRAMRIVISSMPNVEGWVIGGTTEDPVYAMECKALVQSLGLESRVRFLGFQDVTEILPKLGVLMVTSISEAQPLAILEAFAAGVPCVAADVGACREQIEGRTSVDRSLGCAGKVVPFANAEALGEAAIELLSDTAYYKACQYAGLRRVRTYYGQEAMLDAYRDVYQKALVA